ncbi:MAG: hypothetical protein IPL22_11415 [Bacteroidetes bacterium]|nr:hypothetical protein [Bacteroidota bacterium]
MKKTTLSMMAFAGLQIAICTNTFAQWNIQPLEPIILDKRIQATIESIGEATFKGLQIFPLLHFKIPIIYKDFLATAKFSELGS